MGADLPSPDGMEFGENAFEHLTLSIVHSAVVPVLVIGADVIRCVGTAFNIAPDGVWVTAAHVIDEALVIAHNSPGSYVALLWTGSGADEDVPDLLGGPIRISTIRRATNGSDLPLLRAGMVRVENQQPLLFPCKRLSARLPRVGTKISAIGYARFSVTSDVSTPELRYVIIEPNFHFTSGEITQVFRQGRDRLILPTACFETSARFDPGMSGGPVSDEEGAVCGVIASGVDYDSGDPGFTSYASASPYVFLLSLSDGNETMTVYDMVERDIVRADAHFERLKVTKRDDGKFDLSFPCQK